MSHMLPPDDNHENIKQEEVVEEINSPLIKFFTVIVVIMGLVLLFLLGKNSFLFGGGIDELLDKQDAEYRATNGGSLGGAGSGWEKQRQWDDAVKKAEKSLEDESMPTPDSLAKEIKAGHMKVLISSPHGDKVIEVDSKAAAVSETIGGDNTKAVPVGGK